MSEKYRGYVFIDAPAIRKMRESSQIQQSLILWDDFANLITALKSEYQANIVRKSVSNILLSFEDPALIAEAMTNVARKVYDYNFNGINEKILIRAGAHADLAANEIGPNSAESKITARILNTADPGQILISESLLNFVPEKYSKHISPLEIPEQERNRINYNIYQIEWGAHHTVDTRNKVNKAKLTVSLADITPNKEPVEFEHEGDFTGILHTQDFFTHPQAKNTDKLCLIFQAKVYVVSPEAPLLKIGRDPTEVELRIILPSVSRFHCDILYQNGTFIFSDHSWNGSYIYDEEGMETYLHNDQMELSKSGVISPSLPGNCDEGIQIRFVTPE